MEKRARFIALLGFIPLVAAGQTTINGGRLITGAWDASSATLTKPAKTGSALPGTCVVGEQFFKSDATSGQNLYFCTATNTWTQMASGPGGGGLNPPASGSGILKGSAGSATTNVALAGTDYSSPAGVENVANKTLDASNSLDGGALKTGTLDAARLPAVVPRKTDLLGRQAVIINPLQAKTHQYKVGLHSHSTNSDGARTPLQVQQDYASLGFNALANTDHDFVTADAGQGILYIGGAEETITKTITGGTGHMLALGVTSQDSTTSPKTLLADVFAVGGVVQVAHPNCSALSYQYTDASLEDVHDFSLIEVWNPHTNCSPNGLAEDRWDYALTRGIRVWGSTADDSHTGIGGLNPPGRAWVMVNADTLTAAEILSALKAGNFYPTEGPDLTVTVSGTTITATSSAAGVFHWVKEGGVTVQADSGSVTTHSYTLTGREQYIRVDFTRTSDSKRAWGQPIFIERISGGYNDGAQRVQVASAGNLIGSAKRVNFPSGATVTYDATNDKIDVTPTTASPTAVQDEGTGLAAEPTINFTGAGVTCADNPANSRTNCDIPGASSNAYNTIQNSGTGLTQRSTVNFTGSGVTCVDNAGATKTDCTITAGSGSVFDQQTLAVGSDEFYGVPSGRYGQLGWNCVAGAGSGGCAQIAGVQNHPGIYRVTSGANSGDNYWMYLMGESPYGLNATTFELRGIMRVNATSACSLGFASYGGPFTEASSKIVIRFDPALGDSTFRFLTCAAGSCNKVASTITPTATNWYNFRIRSTVAGTVLYSVNGETEASVSTNVPTIAVDPATGSKYNGGASTCDIDWIAWSVGVSR